VPWKATRPVDQKIEFLTRLRNGERMTDLCLEYGIARKTGHKLAKRFEQLGALGLEEQSRAPKHIPHKTTLEVAKLLIAERRKHQTWGARKLKAVLEKRLEHPLPSPSAIHGVLLRAGLIERQKRRAYHQAQPTHLRKAEAPNEVWCIDYKGQFRLGDKSYCYPLTLTDQYSRYLLGCEAMARISDEEARDACEQVFREYGLPAAIRSDNGTPFASTGLAGLTKLSAYWMRLGIALERIRPAKPQDNGRHERMHRTLKRETTRPARANLLQQQERFDAFLDEYNRERPHEALAMRRPAEVYQPSARPHPAQLPELTYPTHDDVLRVYGNGAIHIPGRGKVRLSLALAGQLVGIRELDDGRWLISYCSLDLGYFDGSTTLIPIQPNPQGTNEVLPMCLD